MGVQGDMCSTEKPLSVEREMREICWKRMVIKVTAGRKGGRERAMESSRSWKRTDRVSLNPAQRGADEEERSERRGRWERKQAGTQGFKATRRKGM